jgi:HD-GYP domain-containing protein (c-di-GMP phosphodiesterase class II)
VAFSQALDLAEGRQTGHAARVCYLALSLAQGAGVPPEGLREVFFGALLHDAGAAPASAEACRLLNLSEEQLFGGRPGQSPQQLAMQAAPQHGAQIVRVLREHLEQGAAVARELGFDAGVQETIATHHERWDGLGYPRALKGEAIPLSGRIVGAADLIESLIEAEGNPLTARRNLAAALAEHEGHTIDPDLARLARDLVRSDALWLGLHDGALTQELGARLADEAPLSNGQLTAFAKVFANLADAKGEHTAGHSDRTAIVASDIAGLAGFDEEHRRRLFLAALLHDIGLLGVPARVIAKPDILSLAEMETMRRHPTYSQMVLELLPGMSDVASWAGAHHERPDGKGYPELLEAEQIPLEARIIALADTYVALTSPRPYRHELSPEDAQQVLVGGAGSQLDKKLVQLFCAGPPTSSRSARRSARRR